jgi:hypothetical protein
LFEGRPFGTRNREEDRILSRLHWALLAGALALAYVVIGSLYLNLGSAGKVVAGG